MLEATSEITTRSEYMTVTTEEYDIMKTKDGELFNKELLDRCSKALLHP